MCSHWKKNRLQVKHALLHISIKMNLAKNGVGTWFPCVTTEKALNTKHHLYARCNHLQFKTKDNYLPYFKLQTSDKNCSFTISSSINYAKRVFFQIQYFIKIEANTKSSLLNLLSRQEIWPSIEGGNKQATTENHSGQHSAPTEGGRTARRRADLNPYFEYRSSGNGKGWCGR